MRNPKTQSRVRPLSGGLWRAFIVLALLTSVSCGQSSRSSSSDVKDGGPQDVVSVRGGTLYGDARVPIGGGAWQTALLRPGDVPGASDEGAPDLIAGGRPFLGRQDQWSTILEEFKVGPIGRATLDRRFGQGPLADCYTTRPPPPAAYGETALRSRGWIVVEDLRLFGTEDEAMRAWEIEARPSRYTNTASTAKVTEPTDSGERSSSCPQERPRPETECEIASACAFTDSTDDIETKHMYVVRAGSVLVVLYAYSSNDAVARAPDTTQIAQRAVGKLFSRSAP